MKRVFEYLLLVVLFLPVLSCAKGPARVKVSGITLTPESLSLNVGEDAVLTATLMPENAYNKSVRWTSSDPAVVFVDAEGRVLALHSGSASITVTSVDGAFTDECKVMVVGTENPNPNPDPGPDPDPNPNPDPVPDPDPVPVPPSEVGASGHDVLQEKDIIW